MVAALNSVATLFEFHCSDVATMRSHHVQSVAEEAIGLKPKRGEIESAHPLDLQKLVRRHSNPKRRFSLSTRPSVSMIRCSPVKNGWHVEQISIRSSGFVEPVVWVAPHEQMTLASG
jgi:hypothetical protein